MRQIKFRAWDGSEIHYLPNNTLWDKHNALSGVFEIMQYTGLKDKHGKEIYEGDILNIGANESEFVTNAKGKNVNYEVKVVLCDYILQRTDLELNWGRLSRVEEINWTCQVIGNIYEHPHLLEK